VNSFLESVFDTETGHAVGALAVTLIVCATILVGLGAMTVDAWTSFAQYIFTAFAGATVIHGGAKAIANRGQPAPPEQKAP
jgi:hypothetical protein